MPPSKSLTTGDTFVTGIVADASAGTVVVTYTGTLGADESHIVMFSAPQSPGRMKYRESKSWATTDTAVSPIAAGATYVAKYGAITSLAGRNIYYKVMAIDDATGQKREAGNG